MTVPCRHRARSSPVPSAVKVPALFNLVAGGKTPPVTVGQLREAGYALVILPGLNIHSAANAMRATLERAAGGDVSPQGTDSPRGLFELVGLGSAGRRYRLPAGPRSIPRPGHRTSPGGALAHASAAIRVQL